METTAATTTATLVAAAPVSTASAGPGAHMDAPPPSFGGGRGWFRQRLPCAGVVVPLRIGSWLISLLAPSPSSDLEGIRLRCASYGRGVLHLPRSLPRALRETLAQGGSSPGSPTQSGSTMELTVHSPIHLGGVPGIHTEPHVDVVGVSPPQGLEREAPGLEPHRRSSLYLENGAPITVEDAGEVEAPTRPSSPASTTGEAGSPACPASVRSGMCTPSSTHTGEETQTGSLFGVCRVGTGFPFQ